MITIITVRRNTHDQDPTTPGIGCFHFDDGAALIQSQFSARIYRRLAGGASNADTSIPLAGGSDSDLYTFNSGDGKDTITETLDPADVDVLRLGAGITAAGMSVVRQGNNLILSANGGADQITLVAAYSGTRSLGAGVDASSLPTARCGLKATSGRSRWRIPLRQMTQHGAGVRDSRVTVLLCGLHCYGSEMPCLLKYFQMIITACTRK